MGSQGKAEACFLLLISDALPHRMLLSPCSAKCLLIDPLTPQNVVSVTVSGFVLITVQKTAPDLLDGTASLSWQILYFGSGPSLRRNQLCTFLLVWSQVQHWCRPALVPFLCWMFPFPQQHSLVPFGSLMGSLLSCHK